MFSGTLFVIALTTSRMFMPGMPAINVPGMPNMNAPQRTMTMDLYDPKKPDASFKAACAVPEGLKVGPKVDLTIDLPQPVRDTPTKPGKDEPGKMQDFKLKTYWSCSETVPAGQPKVIDSKEMTQAMRDGMAKSKEFQAAMKRSMAIMANADSTHGYWPGAKGKNIGKDSTAPGSYALTTNFCGGTSVVLDKPQDFLAPIEIVSPGAKIDFEKSIRVEWKAVPNAQGYIVTAFSGSNNEMITWTSSQDPNKGPDAGNRAISRAELDSLIKSGVVLPPEKTFCYVPAGIFKTTKNAMLMITAIGADKIQDKDKINTQVVVRSNAMMMAGMMGGGMDGEGSQPKTKPATDTGNQTGDAVNTGDQPKDQPADSDTKPKDLLKRAKDLLKRR